MHIQTSPAFQRSVKKTLSSILIFVIVYMLLLIAAIGLTIALTYFGIHLIIEIPNLYIILFGAGLIFAGLTILFFLIKFIFSKNQNHTEGMFEITADMQPELFQMIHEVVQEAGTDFPKKVFLTQEVNASVFYNSSFWSMIIPVRKNLQIGMGLINVLSKQELKAIIAHEFGHFSQRSMKLGSYVYHVNQVIFNMLYNNESFDRTINRVSGWSNSLVITLWGAIYAIRGIQWILKKLYNFINKNYMALSREMEFHADEVAAHVAGSEAFTSSLMRLDFADHAFNEAVQFYYNRSSESLFPDDIYADHQTMLRFLAKKNSYEMKDGMPLIDLDSNLKYDKSKLNFENQWASHPSTADRVKKVRQLNIVKTVEEDSPAMDMIKDKDKVISEISDFLFKNLFLEDEGPNANIPIVKLGADEFIRKYELAFNKRSFDKVFNEYYNLVTPVISDYEKIDLNGNIPERTYFSDEDTELTYELQALRQDIGTLKSIQAKEIGVKTFDYDGIKFHRKAIPELLERLKKEEESKAAELDELNIQIFKHFHHLAKSKNLEQEFLEAHLQLAAYDKIYEDQMNFYYELNNKFSYLNQVLDYDQIETFFIEFKVLELRLKKELKELLEYPGFENELDKKYVENLEKYMDKDWKYFMVSAYVDENIMILREAMEALPYLIYQRYFLQKKKILAIQANLM